AERVQANDGHNKSVKGPRVSHGRLPCPGILGTTAQQSACQTPADSRLKLHGFGLSGKSRAASGAGRVDAASLAVRGAIEAVERLQDRDDLASRQPVIDG